MGAWYGKPDEEECLKTLTYAADRGVTFWDTADVYGTSKRCVTRYTEPNSSGLSCSTGEALLGKWFKTTGRRSEIFLATKFGSMNLNSETERFKPCSRPSYIQQRIDASLKALGVDCIDLYYQHRVDPEVPIEGESPRITSNFRLTETRTFSCDENPRGVGQTRKDKVHWPKRLQYRRVEESKGSPWCWREADCMSDGV